MAILVVLFVIAWVAVAVLGTQAYFRGEQSKPVHERNWRSASFAQLSKAVTGSEVNYSDRTCLYQGTDAYFSAGLPDA
jgi:hypothetical protein